MGSIRVVEGGGCSDHGRVGISVDVADGVVRGEDERV